MVYIGNSVRQDTVVGKTTAAVPRLAQPAPIEQCQENGVLHPYVLKGSESIQQTQRSSVLTN